MLKACWEFFFPRVAFKSLSLSPCDVRCLSSFEQRQKSCFSCSFLIYVCDLSVSERRSGGTARVHTWPGNVRQAASGAGCTLRLILLSTLLNSAELLRVFQKISDRFHPNVNSVSSLSAAGTALLE